MDGVGVPAAAAEIFGDRLELAVRFTELLATEGPRRGLIGPRETDRLWDRHVLNSVVVGELLAPGERIVDVGSGAGLPGIPLAIARPDVSIDLLEPMARRVEWLEEVLAELGLTVRVHRGRAEESTIRALGPWDVATARAVAPLGKLAGWCLPLVRPGGRMLALKGVHVNDELMRDDRLVRAAGAATVEVRECGAKMVDVPTTVVIATRSSGDVAGNRSQARGHRSRDRQRKEQ